MDLKAEDIKIDTNASVEDTNEHDKTYENEQSTVTLPIKEYDKLKDRQKYITDKSLIEYIDKIEFFVKELRKHIIRSEL